MKQRLVYFFGGGKADGTAEMKSELGGKGAGLAEMSKAGIPVPPGFTIATMACTRPVRSPSMTGASFFSPAQTERFAPGVAPASSV